MKSETKKIVFPKKNSLPIAVLDSGVGGISVLKELLTVIPNENYIFFGDEANAPYGTKRREEVTEITFKNTEMLIEKYGIKALVIACNTATGAAVSALREKYSDMPIIGIEPEIKTAAFICEQPNVLIMATPLTLKQPKFLELEKRFSDLAEYTLLPCDGLMELIEAGHLSDKTLDNYLDTLLYSLFDKHFDAIVLGCTHYPHIKDEISKRFPKAQIFDGCHGTAVETRRRIIAAGIERSDRSGKNIKFITSGDSKSFIEKCHMLINK